MGELLEKAFAALKSLPDEDRERLAYEILERVEDKTEWDNLIKRPASQQWLDTASRAALKAYKKSTPKVSMVYINSALDTPLREGAYWEGYDQLPLDVRKLAEENFQLWKENSKNPGLRFKQIHETLPVFSFRVGMKHRTVGVETPDGRIVWFWVGSFETFKHEVDS